jgi:exosortase A
VSAVLPLPMAAPTPWRHALAALALLLLAIVALYFGTFSAMAGIWMRSDTFAHAVLVPPITLWLVWRRRAALLATTPVPTPWLLAPMAAVAGVWLLGDMAGVNAVTQLCATALLVLAVPAVLGLAAARQIAFPLAFLFFMVPLGEFLIPVMMEGTADFTVAAVRLSGVPVYREGLNFVIPTGSWSVVEACSGVRYLIASFMVGTLFAYLNYSSARRRWLFVLMSLLVPVVANWLRAYMIVMLGHISGNTVAVGVDHLIYGWLFFGVVIGIMFVVGARWSQPEAGVVLTQRADLPVPAPRATWLVCVLALALLALPAAAAWQMARPAISTPVNLSLPVLAGSESTAATPALSPSFPGAAALLSQGYRSADAVVTVHIAYFRRQGYGAKLGSSENVLVSSTDRAWSRTTTGGLSVTVNGSALALRTAEFSSGGGAIAERRRVEARQLYYVAGRFTASDKWATLLGIWARLSGQGSDGAVLSFYTEGDAQQTRARLDAFIGAHLHSIEAALRAARAAP